MPRLSLATLAVALLAGPSLGQPFTTLSGGSGGEKSFDDVGTVDVKVVPEKAKPGEVVTVKLTVTPLAGAWTYPANPPAGQFALNEIEPPRRGTLIFVGPVVDPAGWEDKASAIPGQKDRVYKHAVTWELTAVVSPTETPGTKTVPLKGVSIQVCKTKCFNTDRQNPPTATFEVLPGPAAEVPAQYAADVKRAVEPEAPKAASPPGGSAAPTAKPAGGSQKNYVPAEEYRKGLESISPTEATAGPSVEKHAELGTLLLTAAFWGLVSLVTPCVFPMIPITVSLFLKQSNQSPKQAAKMAGVYCLTIIVILGVSALVLLSVFRALSIHPAMNIFLGGLFAFFAVGLFGLYEVSLGKVLAFLLLGLCVLGAYGLSGFGVPLGVALLSAGVVYLVLLMAGRKLLSAESRVLQYTEGKRKAGGLLGVVFGAVAFSIVSFTCVAPFLGGFAGLIASGQYNYFELALAGLTFATAFALPFFVLALFPSLLKSMPRSGGWLDSVKVVMGFLELAAAFKFFRTAELRLADQTAYFTYDTVLGGWVVIAGVAGLYLLNFFRLPHDEEKPHVGVVRMIIALIFLGFGVYLTPALFKSAEGDRPRPSGVVYAWVDAFLLPEPEPSAGDHFAWGSDLKAAVERIAKARRDGKPVEKPLIFVDFTGVTCTNCRINEENVFPRPEVRDLLKQYELVQLYTDDVPAGMYSAAPDIAARKAEAYENLQFQRRLFGTEQLPLYAILEPQASGKFKIVKVYDEGKINDVAAFTAFLKEPLAGK